MTNFSTFGDDRKPATGSGPLLLLYALGMLISGYLVSLSIREGGGAFCELLAGNCLSVITSDYGSFLGLSVSSMGLGYFALQFSLLALGRLRGSEAALAPFSFALSLIAAAVSLFFIYVMIRMLHERCIACYGVHAINFAALGLSARHCRRLAGGLGAALKAGRPGIEIPLAVLAGLSLLLAVNLAEAHHLLRLEQEKLAGNLQYHRYLYQTAPKHVFSVEPTDRIEGDPDYATHQVVLIHKDGCRHCEQAREKLTSLVKDHDLALYLVMRNYKDVLPEKLKELGVTRAPAVFIDGQRAEGWDIPEFMKEFAEDCGC